MHPCGGHRTLVYDPVRFSYRWLAWRLRYCGAHRVMMYLWIIEFREMGGFERAVMMEQRKYELLIIPVHSSKKWRLEVKDDQLTTKSNESLWASLGSQWILWALRLHYRLGLKLVPLGMSLVAPGACLEESCKKGKGSWTRKFLRNNTASPQAFLLHPTLACPFQALPSAWASSIAIS